MALLGPAIPIMRVGLPTKVGRKPSKPAEVVPAHQLTAARALRSNVDRVEAALAGVLSPGNDDLEIADLYRAYRQRCRSAGSEALEAKSFAGAVEGLTRRLDIDIQTTDSGVYLKGVKLKVA